MGSGVRPWPVLPLYSTVTLDFLFNFSNPQFSHLLSADSSITYPIELQWELKEIMQVFSTVPGIERANYNFKILDMSLMVGGIQGIPKNVWFQNDWKILLLKDFLGDDSY